MPKTKPGHAHITVTDVPLETVNKLKARIKLEAEKSGLPVPKLAAYVRQLIHHKVNSHG